MTFCGPPARSISTGNAPLMTTLSARIDAIGRQSANPLGHAVTVCHGLRAEETQVAVVGGTGGADYSRAVRNRELNGSGADASGGAVDQDCLAGADAELIETARRRFERNRERCGVDEAEGRWQRRANGQERQLCCRALVGDAENPVADGNIRHTLADLIDDACNVTARSLRQGIAEIHLS